MRTCFFFALLLAAAPALAQSPSFGLKAGLNVSSTHSGSETSETLESIEGIDRRPRLGFVGGVTLDVPLTPVLGLRTEALYAQKGHQIDYDLVLEIIDGDDLVTNGALTARIDYLELPVLLSAVFPVWDGLEIGLQGGVAPALKLNTSTGCSGFEERGGCEEFLSVADFEVTGIKSFDLGGALGLTIGAGPFAVDARYTRSIPRVDENDDFSETFLSPQDARNGVISLTGTYRFGR